MKIKIEDIPLIVELTNTAVETVLKALAADAAAKGKGEITLEELETLKIKPRQEVIDQLKAIANKP